MASIINFYEHLPKKYGGSAHVKYANWDTMRINLPTRIAIVGASGSGKSNCTLNLILGAGCFTRIYFVVKSPDEPLYQFFEDEMRKVEAKLGFDILTVLTNVNDLPHVDEFDKKKTNLVLFDDVITDAKSKLAHISDFWVRGRKQNITTIFLSQSYFQIPKLIRDNTDVLMLKSISSKLDLKRILSEKAMDKTADELVAMYKSCNTTDVSNFFLIDTGNMSVRDPAYKYRHNYDPIV